MTAVWAVRTPVPSPSAAAPPSGPVQAADLSGAAFCTWVTFYAWSTVDDAPGVRAARPAAEPVEHPRDELGLAMVSLAVALAALVWTVVLLRRGNPTRQLRGDV